MSEDNNMASECQAFTEDLVELALGTLNGRHRVALLAHVDDCSSCSAEVEQLSGVVDELLLQAPLVEPPVGFEAKVFERLNLHPRRSGALLRFITGHRALALSLAGAVAALLLVVGVVAGHLSTSSGGPLQVASGRGGYLQVAQLESNHHIEGEVMVYPGNPTWLFMYVDDPSWQGELRCEVTIDDGPTITVGKFWPTNGDGAWAAKVSQPAGRLRQARVVAPDGTVLATATLS